MGSHLNFLASRNEIFYKFFATALMLMALTFCFSCEDKFYKEKFDVELSITNKTETTIPKIRIDGANGSKVWVFQNIKPENTEIVRFNIKRDFKVSEGGLTLTAFLNEKDSVLLNTGYFTNWRYQGPTPANFNVFVDRIEVAK